SDLAHRTRTVTLTAACDVRVATGFQRCFNAATGGRRGFDADANGELTHEAHEASHAAGYVATLAARKQETMHSTRSTQSKRSKGKACQSPLSLSVLRVLY